MTVAAEGGVVTLTLWDTKDGTKLGVFAGPAEGLAVGTMSGKGKLIVS